MLPFLEKKRQSGIISGSVGKPGTMVSPEREAPGEEPHFLKDAAEEILGAIERKSVIDLAHALEAAFYMLDSMPHEEGPHIEGEE